MILTFICLISAILFLISINSKSNKYSSPDGPPIIPRMDTMIDSKSECAPPPCAPGGWDKRDIGIAMPGCSKTFIDNPEKQEKKIEPEYYEGLEDEFLKYRMTVGSDKPFRDIYDSFDRIQQVVYQTPKNTLHERTENPRNRTFLTTMY